LLGTVVVLGIAGLYATLPVHETLPSLVRRIAALGPWADAVFVLVYAVASVLLFPVWLLTLAGGAVFGVARGSVLVLTGATLGAIASFVLARTGLREFVLKRARAYPDFESLDRAIAARGGWIVFLVRLSPVFPFVYVNYLLGLTAIPAATYTAATIVGMIPATVVYVAIGASAGAAASGQAASWSTLRIALTFAGVAAAVVVSIIVARIATGAVRKTGAEETLRESPLPRE
jgi:uncharacterized membrane protein YdjX (TVP38/TMEM64 family)